jgi:hypothetical protein
MDENSPWWGRLGCGILLLSALTAFAIIGLIGWGFVEIIQWVTSK